jgi:hypothetical protein
MRDELGKVMRETTEQTRDSPAWLRGTAEMNKLDRELSRQVRETIESQERDHEHAIERERLKTLAEKEKS